MCSNPNLDQTLQLVQWARDRGFHDVATQLGASQNGKHPPSIFAKSTKLQPHEGRHLCEIQLHIPTRDDELAGEGYTAYPKEMAEGRSSAPNVAPQSNIHELHNQGRAAANKALQPGAAGHCADHCQVKKANPETLPRRGSTVAQLSNSAGSLAAMNKAGQGVKSLLLAEPHTETQGEIPYVFLPEGAVRTLLESMRDLHSRQDTFEKRLLSWMACQSDCCKRLEEGQVAISDLLCAQPHSNKVTAAQVTAAQVTAAQVTSVQVTASPKAHFEGKTASSLPMTLQSSENGVMEKARWQWRFPGITSSDFSLLESGKSLAVLMRDYSEDEEAEKAQCQWPSPSAFCESVIYVIIILNSIQLGFAADFPHSPWKGVWLVCEHLFTAVYTVEMLLLIAVHRLAYFKQGALLFDCAVAIISILNVWILPLVGMSASTRFMQLFKLSRLLRVMRVFRLKPELWELVNMLAASFKKMFFIGVLVALLLYVVAICCVEVLGGPDSGYPAYSKSSASLDEGNNMQDFNNYMYFGTVRRSMSTLLGIVLLSEWALTRPVTHIHPFFFPLLMTVVLLVTFGLLNIMVGIVVERVTLQVRKMEDQHREKHKMQQEQITSKLADLFFEMDSDANAKLSLSELTAAVKSLNSLQDVLQLLNLPIAWTPAEMLRMLDLDGSGWLSRNEFVNGMARLIYCNEFQRDCVHAMTMGMVHHALRTARDELREDIRKVIDEIRLARQ